MNILITGIAGLLGSRLAEYILENTQDSVIGIDACEAWGNTIANVPSKISDFYKVDLSKDNISSIFEKYDFDCVYHFAAYAAEGLSPFMREFNYYNNVISTVKIINECIKHNVKRLVYTSSMSVYGRGVDGKEGFSEDDALAPIDPYAISKYACEMDIQVANKQHGLEYCIIRPHNVFGRNQNVNDKYRNVLGIWMHQAIKGEPMTIYGDGLQSRSFTEVENILPYLYYASYRPEFKNEVFNLGGLKPLTINELMDIFSGVSGYKNIIYKEPRFEVKHAVPLPDKSISKLNYHDAVSIEDGIRNMWLWTKESGRVGDWYEWDGFELDNKIYSYWSR